MGDFYDDLATFISSICVEAGERLLLCGDLNCADSQGRINDTLTPMVFTSTLKPRLEEITSQMSLLLMIGRLSTIRE